MTGEVIPNLSFCKMWKKILHMLNQSVPNITVLWDIVLVLARPELIFPHYLWKGVACSHVESLGCYSIPWTHCWGWNWRTLTSKKEGCVDCSWKEKRGWGGLVHHFVHCLEVVPQGQGEHILRVNHPLFVPFFLLILLLFQFIFLSHCCFQ